MTGRGIRGVAVALLAGCLLSLSGASGAAPPAQEAASDPPEAAPPASAGAAGARAEAGAAPAAPNAESAAAAAPARDGERTAAAVRRAWWGGSEDPTARTRAARRAALQHGIWNLDPAARALIGPELNGTDFEAARAAVALSPDLPAARMALARETWLEGDAPISAARAAFEALLAIPRHFEASVWFSATLLCILALALIAGGLATLAVYGVLSFIHAAHDVGDLVPAPIPGFARVALLGSAVLVPLAMHQGVLGLALPLFALGLIYGAVRQRAILCVACFAVLVGAFPLAKLAGALLTAYADAPTEAAVFTTDGFALSGELRRLESVEEIDSTAAMALAMAARRAGGLADADARYRRLVEWDSANLAAANNAANVKVELGDLEGAIDLYRRSLAGKQSATVLFNLSQAQGQAFQLDDVGPTLEAAQRLDSARVAELTLLQGSDLARFTVDLPLPRGALWERILSPRSGEPFSTEIRSSIAPGFLGRDVGSCAGAFVAVAILSLLAAIRWKTSHWCGRCGRRMCPRCEPELGEERDCESCNGLFRHPEATDRAMRAARVNALRYREQRVARVRLALSVLLPGVAGALARRPLASFAGALSAAVAILAIHYRNGVTPDPLVAGAAAPFAFGSLAALASLAYAASVALSLAARSRS